MTFDSLRPRYDHVSSMTLTMTAQGPEAFAFSPLFGTWPHMGDGALILGDPGAALARSVMMSDERRAYLAKRWAHWQKVELDRRADPHAIWGYRVGRE